MTTGPNPEGTRAATVSVVVPVRDGAETIAAQLDALTRQGHPEPFEIIVADNGSSDDTRAIASRYPGVRVVDASARRGPNHARNVGARHATGALILTCDADDIAPPGWVTAMADALADADLVGGRLDYLTLNPEHGARAAANAEFSGRLGFLPSAAGASFGIRASALWALGGWDEALQGGGDDTDLCWRAQLAGYRFAWVEEPAMQYRLRRGTGAVVRQAYAGARWLPTIVRRFRRQGMPLRPLIMKAVRFSGYLVVMAVPALVVPRIRVEWMRRAALGAGLVRGLRRPRL